MRVGRHHWVGTWLRVVNTLATALVAGVVCASGAWATTPSPDTPEQTQYQIRWDGSATARTIPRGDPGAEPAVETKEGPAELILTCSWDADWTCRLEVTFETVTDSPTSNLNTMRQRIDDIDNLSTISAERPASGDICQGDETEDLLARLTATGTLAVEGAQVVMLSDGFYQRCEGVTEGIVASLQHGREFVFEGASATGDLCLLQGLTVCINGLPLVEVTPQPLLPVETLEPQPPLASTAPSASELGTGSAAAPSVLSALPPVQEVELTVVQVCLAAAATVVLSLLVAWPKKLYASAISGAPARWAEFTAWLAAGRGPVRRRLAAAVVPPKKSESGASSDAAATPEPVHEKSDAIGSRAWLIASAGVVAAAVVSAFVDPEIGFNWGSVRLLLSLAASFLLNVVVGWQVAIFFAKRLSPGVATSYTFKPWSLLIVALTVAVVRVTGLEPGMVFGLVAGVAIGRLASQAVESKLALVQTAYAFALGLVGWGIYSAAAPSLQGNGNVFAQLFLDTASGLAVAGFAAAPLALLPVAGMGGSKVYDWNKRVWFALYSAGLLGFLVVLMPMPTSWSTVDVALSVWIGVYLVYALLAVALYLGIVRPWDKSGSEASAEGVDGEV